MSVTVKKANEVEPDLMLKLKTEFAQLGQSELLAALPTVLDVELEGALRLGVLLSLIQDKKAFQPLENFAEFCEAHRIGKSRGYALVKVSRFVMDADVSWPDAKDIGWSKLHEIAARAERLDGDDKPTQVQKWLGLAKTATRDELIAAIKPKATVTALKPKAKPEAVLKQLGPEAVLAMFRKLWGCDLTAAWQAEREKAAVGAKS